MPQGAQRGWAAGEEEARLATRARRRSGCRERISRGGGDRARRRSETVVRGAAEAGAGGGGASASDKHRHVHVLAPVFCRASDVRGLCGARCQQAAAARCECSLQHAAATAARGARRQPAHWNGEPRHPAARAPAEPHATPRAWAVRPSAAVAVSCAAPASTSSASTAAPAGDGEQAAMRLAAGRPRVCGVRGLGPRATLSGQPV